MKSIIYSGLIATSILLASCSGSSSTEENKNTDEHKMEEHPHEAKADTETKKKPASPQQQAMAMVGNNHIHIEYSSPSVRGRVIWGGLVPYGRVWSTGAHKATSINFPESVMINGEELPAGKYGFFTIPGESTWTVIFNKTWNMHLADDYSEADDVLRFEVTPEKLDSIQEALAYKVVSTGDNSGTLSVAWEHTKIAFNVTNK
ncbi:MAG: DUF2911 domain-containing protein [Cyclobacteriaceae bacterium]|nr:DUF2911 domain-containing protein [Cyclobacteriaceae bacterium]